MEDGRGKGMKMSRGPHFFACHFLKPLKFFWGVPKWKFLTVKKHFTPGKNQEM